MLKDVLEKAELHISRGETAKAEIESWGDFSHEVFENSEKIKTIDSFILRFIKLQDIIGQKVFKSFLDEIGDYRDDMSFLDILDRLEKLGIIDSADQWMTYRKIRNELTHEYPDNLTEIADGIKLALAAFDQTTKVLQLLKERKVVPGT
jgi:hypothetical protein